MVKNNWLYYSLNLNPCRQLRNANVQTAKCTCEAKIPVATIAISYLFLFELASNYDESTALCIRATHS